MAGAAALRTVVGVVAGSMRKGTVSAATRLIVSDTEKQHLRASALTLA
jgi:hypothetical protein